MISEEIYLKIVRSAIKAPSGHNTQPWLFTKGENEIFIKPDFSRALPIADPENRELFISLGCAHLLLKLTPYR
jgi:nitroreductase